MTRTGLLAAAGAFLAVIISGLLIATYLNPELTEFNGVNIFDSIEPAANTELIPHGYYSENLYNKGYERAGEVEPIDARSAIVAHHLVVNDEITKVIEGLAQGNKRSDTIIIISPNHFYSGHDDVQVGTVGYSTPFGNLMVRDEIVNELLESDLVKEAGLGFDGEHGVAAITPIIKKSFPDAEIVPIIVKESLSGEDAEKLGELLASVVDKRTVVLGSIDMSHVMPLDYQEFHDDITMKTIAGGLEAALAINLEIDSNATMRTLLALNRELGTEVWNQTYHGSTLASGVTETAEENTSHILGYFTKGSPAEIDLESWLVTSDEHILSEASADRFYLADRRSFGTNHVVTWDKLTPPEACKAELNSLTEKPRTLGLLNLAESCIIYPLN